MSEIKIRILNNNDDDDDQMSYFASAFDYAALTGMTVFYFVLQHLLGFTGPVPLLASNVASAASFIALKATTGKSSFAQTLSGMDAEQIKSSFEKGLLFISGTMIVIIYISNQVKK